jgi:hypothetical protein
LDVWTFEQLRKIVGEFKNSKQKVPPVFDLTGAGANGLYEFDQLQSPTAMSGGPSGSQGGSSAPDHSSAQSAKFKETKQQLLTNKNQQMKHDLEDIFADLDALKVKKVNDLFNLNGALQSQSKSQTGHFSDFEINDKGEIVLLSATPVPEAANTVAVQRTEPHGGKLAVSGRKQPGDGQKKPERRKREEPVQREPAAEQEEPAEGSARLAVEVVK